jgi:hypothetical protein
MIEKPTLVAPDLEDDIPFNGVNTCFVTFPKSVAALPAIVGSQSGLGWGCQTWERNDWYTGPVANAPDSDDEDAIIDPNQVDPYRASAWGDRKHNINSLSNIQFTHLTL